LLTLDSAGRWLLADCWDRTCLFDLIKISEPVLLEVQEQQLGVAEFSMDGLTLVAAAPSGQLYRMSLGEVGVGSPDPWARLSAAPTWLSELSDRRWAARNETGVLILDAHGDVCAHLPFEPEDSGMSFGPKLIAGRWLVHSGFKTLRRWDLLAADPAETEETFLGLEHAASQIAVSPDGGLLVTAESDGPVRFWRTAVSHAEAITLDHDDDMVMVLAFREAARQLVTMASEGVIRAWDLDLDRLCARARAVAGRDLTEEERLRFLGAGVAECS
jgi:WD40 repeat protein